MKVKRKQLQEMTINQLINFLLENDIDINLWLYDDLKELIKDEIENDNFNYALHLIDAIKNSDTEIFIYDKTCGVFDTPLEIKTVEDLIDQLENYITII